MEVRSRIEQTQKPIEIYDYINGDEGIDVREMLARQKVNIMFSNFRLDTEDKKLKEIFDNIKKNNDLMQLMKGMERYLSKDGKAYLVFDVFEKGEYGYVEKTIKLMMGVPYEGRNQTVRQFQQKEWVGTVVIQTTSTKQGMRQKVYQCRTFNETQNVVLDSALPRDGLPLDVFYVKTPDFLIPYMEPHTRVHNYGVLSMKEMLNKNIVDFADENDIYLTDDYPVSYLREVINSYLVFMKEEQKKNGTKWAGTFGSFADMFQKSPDIATFAYASKNGGKLNATEVQRLIEQNRQDKSILENDYIMKLNTGGDTKLVEKMQSTFSMEDMMRGLCSLLEIYFNGAGFDYSVQTMSGATQYTSSSEIQTQNRRTTETIKECILLRQEQFTEMINKIIDAYEGKVDAHKKYIDKWDFKIISNIVNEEAYSVEKIVTMLENGLISRELAIEKANKDLNATDLQDLIKQIEKEQAEEEAKELKMMEQNNSMGGPGDE